MLSFLGLYYIDLSLFRSKGVIIWIDFKRYSWAFLDLQLYSCSLWLMIAIQKMVAIIQESCLITRKTLLIDILAFALDLHYIDLSWFGKANFFFMENR